MEKQELALLVSSLKKGDKDAAGPIYDAYYNDIYLFILKVVKDPHLASDLTQDTFVEILETIEKLRIPSAFLPWSKMIAYHKCTAYFKKKKELLADEKYEDYYLLDMRVEERTEFIPDASIDQDELKHTIWNMLDSLPEEQRAAILMRYYDEISVKDIATVQKVSEGTVKSRLNYARKAIKDSVIEYEQKNNVKLHCRGVVPVLLWFFRENRLDKGISLTELTPFAETIGKFAEKATKILFKKIIAAVFASLLVTGGITQASNLNYKPSVDGPVISTEDSNSEFQDNSETGNIVTDDNSSEHNSEIIDSSEIEGPITPPISSEDATSSELKDDLDSIAPIEPDSSQSTNPPQVPTPSEKPEQQPEISLGPDASEVPSNELPNLTLSYDESYYIVSDMKNASNSHYTIPATYNGLPVTHIADEAFKDNFNLSSISIPNSITRIGNYAFSSTALTRVTIPDSVISIGEYAFSSCNYLTNATLSNNMVQISDGLFSGCVSLKSLIIPQKVTYIHSSAFRSCLKLTNLIVEKGNSTYHSSGNCIIETATKTLISGCNNSQIPTDGSVNQIDKIAFYGMSFSTFVVPEGITIIQRQAFDFCRNLKSIYLPASLNAIDECTFTNDKQLTDIYYAGTKEQWNATFLKSKYFLPASHTCTIHCSNGDIQAKGESPW